MMKYIRLAVGPFVFNLNNNGNDDDGDDDDDDDDNSAKPVWCHNAQRVFQDDSHYTGVE